MPLQITEEEFNRSQYRIHRSIKALDELNPLIKSYFNSMTNQASGTPELLMAFIMLERNYYNSLSGTALLKEIAHNAQYSVPLCQVFRTLIYDIVIAYWLFSGGFDEKIVRLNLDFIKKGLAKLKIEQPPPSDYKVQLLLQGWSTIAPDNFINNTGRIEVNPAIKSITFTAICDALALEGHNLNGLTKAYLFLSQQAHVSEFSRNLIVDKQVQNIEMFDFTAWAVIRTCSMLVEKVSPSSPICQEIIRLFDFFPDHEQSQTKQMLAKS